MLAMPEAAEPLFDRFRSAFARRPYEWFVSLSLPKDGRGAIPAMARRTTAAVCGTVGKRLVGHWSDSP